MCATPKVFMLIPLKSYRCMDIYYRYSLKICMCFGYTLFSNYVCVTTQSRAPGRFAQKPVPPGTVRAKNIFRTGRFLPGRFAHFSKNDFKVLVIKINQVNAMCMLN